MNQRISQTMLSVQTFVLGGVLWQGYQIQKQTIMMEVDRKALHRPYPKIKLDQTKAKITLCNDGMGPAIITSFTAVDNKSKTGPIKDFLPEHLKNQFIGMRFTDNSTTIQRENTLELLWPANDKLTEKAKDEAVKTLQGLEYHIEYQDVYGRTYTLVERSDFS